MIRSILRSMLVLLLFVVAPLAAPTAMAQGRSDFDHLATGYPLTNVYLPLIK